MPFGLRVASGVSQGIGSCACRLHPSAMAQTPFPLDKTRGVALDTARKKAAGRGLAWSPAEHKGLCHAAKGVYTDPSVGDSKKKTVVRKITQQFYSTIAC
jgi:hypothetical protein